MRVGAYVDGFNLYHAIEALKEPLLKWTDIRALVSSYLREGDTLERVVLYTAYNTWDAAKRKRHQAYVHALESTGVEVVPSHFSKVQKKCIKTGRKCIFYEEKRTDVSIATDMLSDCYERNLDRILLITADSDQIPAVERIRARFPKTAVFMIAPPKRLSRARELGAACNGRTQLTAGRIRDNLLPSDVRDARGKLIASCPARYGPTR